MDCNQITQRVNLKKINRYRKYQIHEADTCYMRPYNLFISKYKTIHD